MTWVDSCLMLTETGQMQEAQSAFDGVSFHCYEGSVSSQAIFTSQYPDKVCYVGRLGLSFT